MTELEEYYEVNNENALDEQDIAQIQEDLANNLDAVEQQIQEDLAKILVGAHMERKKSAAAKVVKIAKNVKNQSAIKLVVRLLTTEANQMQKRIRTLSSIILT